MVPAAFANYFLASASASAALIGLLFVAVSVVPDGIFRPMAPVGRRIRAVSAFVALLDAFFVSITALIPHTNIGYPAVAAGVSALINTLSLGRHVWDERRQGRLWRPAVLLTGSLVIYGLQIWYAVPLILTPRLTDNVYGLAYLLLGAYGVGLGRAWDLLGATNEGLLTLLGLRHEPGEAARGRAGGDSAHPDDRTVRPE
jgi:hypothetical protein